MNALVPEVTQSDVTAVERRPQKQMTTSHGPQRADACAVPQQVAVSTLQDQGGGPGLLQWKRDLEEWERSLKGKEKKLNSKDLQQQELNAQYAACKALNLKLENTIRGLREENQLLKT
jgi:hypothetical protein